MATELVYSHINVVLHDKIDVLDIQSDPAHYGDESGSVAASNVLGQRGVVEIISQHLDANELLQFSEVSVLFREVCDSTDLWIAPGIFDSAWKRNEAGESKRIQVRELHRTRTSGLSKLEEKELNPPEYLIHNPHKLGDQEQQRDITLMLDRVKELNGSDLRKALGRVDLSRCVEKLDYQLHLQALLLFGNRPQLIEGNVSTRSAKNTYPDFALNINPGKASYFHAIKEAKRTCILKTELLNCKWEFFFKYAQDDQGRLHDVEMLNRTCGYQIQKYGVQFFEDGTMQSDIHTERLTYSYEVDCQDNFPLQIESIQVHTYPSLHCYRSRDTGNWVLENQNVVLEGVSQGQASLSPLL